jgi:peptide deformylase
MSILKVARMGHPVLRARARPVERAEIKSAPIQKLIDDLIETMEEYHGIGLAAPQVHEGLRVFVAGLQEDSRSDEDEPAIVPVPLINPEVIPVGAEMVSDWEGCLSIPDIRGQVPRHRRVRVRALDREGGRVELQLADLAARVVQHENDHLDGILFFDRMKTFETLTFLEEYSKFWRDDKD